jgi:hypothetical protein
MQSLLCVRASGTVGKDGIRCNLTSTLESVACECMDEGVLELCRGWRRCGAIRARNTIAAQTPCVQNHYALNTHYDMLYSIRLYRNRACCNTRSCPKASTAAQFVACWPGCGAIGRCQPCPVRPALRHGAGGLRLLPWVLEMRPAPTMRRLVFLTSNLVSCNIALLRSPIATASILCLSDPLCATNALSLLLGSATPFYRWRT